MILSSITITRLIDRSYCWRKLAEESIRRYRDIEQEAGVGIYDEVGYLSLIDDNYKDLDSLKKAVNDLIKSGYKCQEIDSYNSR